MSIWQTVPENEIKGLEARAAEHDGVLQLDDCLSALREEMTAEVVDATRTFWASRGVTLKVDVEPEEDPAADLPDAVLESPAPADGEVVTEVVEVEIDPIDGPAGDLMRRREVRTSRRKPRQSSLPGGTGGAGTADPVRMYLREIGQVPLLVAQEEVDLAMRIESGVFAEERLADLNASGEIEQLDAGEKARLRSWELVEKNEMIFAWHHAEEKPPDWEVPTIDVIGHPDWTTPRRVACGTSSRSWSRRSAG